MTRIDSIKKRIAEATASGPQGLTMTAVPFAEIALRENARADIEALLAVAEAVKEYRNQRRIECQTYEFSVKLNELASNLRDALAKLEEP